MVKVGFIVEGHSEAILVKSESFQLYLNSLELENSDEFVINAVGKNNLYHPDGNFSKLKERVDSSLQILYEKGAEVVFILIDRDNDDSCFTDFKSKIYFQPQNIIIVAVQSLEAWFLADTNAMRKFLQPDIPEIALPESFTEPYNEVDRLRRLYKGKGAGTKVSMANIIVHRCSFSLANAAAHPACPSATYSTSSESL